MRSFTYEATGTQKFLNRTSVDTVLLAYASVTAVYSGTYWFITEP